MTEDNRELKTVHDGTCAPGPTLERVAESAVSFFRELMGSRTYDELSIEDIDELAEEYASRMPGQQLRDALFVMTFGYVITQLSEQAFNRLVAENPGQS